jgi:glycosyltransferase involved in cell wall biosynthesis
MQQPKFREVTSPSRLDSSISENSSQRILQSCLSNSWGGLEMVAFENAQAFNEHHIECHTLCLAGSPLEQHLRAAGLPSHSFGARKNFFDFIKIRRLLLEEHISTVLVQHLRDLSVLTPALFHLANIKVFGISHTFVGVRKKDFLHRWYYSKIDKLICLTELHKQNILQFLPCNFQQMEVIPNYVDCARFTPHNRSEETRQSLGASPGVPLLGIASRLDPQKGQDCAIQALAILKKKNISVRLAIIGENTRNEENYFSTLQKMAMDLDVQDRIHFAGYREDMEKIMASLDVLLMPSLRETFGLVLIEAMASKTAVIATNAGGVPNIIDPEVNGLLVPPQDPQALANAIESLISKPDYYQRLIEGAYFKVRAQYSKETVEAKLLDLLAH